MEFVLNKIIEIDNKVIDLQNRTEETIKEKKSFLDDEIKNLDEKLINNSNTELEAEVQKKIADAEKMANSISTDAKEKCQSIQNKYLAVKDVLKKQIFNEIIEIS